MTAMLAKLWNELLHPTEAFWTMVQTVVIPISIWLLIRQLRLQRLGNMATTLSVLDDRWASESMRQARRSVCQYYGSGTDRLNRPEEAICGFFETVAIYVRNDVLPLAVVWDSYSFYSEHYWAMMQPHIAALREELADKTYFRQFEWLQARLEWYGRHQRADLCQRIFRCPPPAPPLDITKFIKGEQQTENLYDQSPQ